MKKLRVAIIGQGRSGRNIHGAYFLTDAGKALYEVVAVADLIEFRRERARSEFGCDFYSDYRDMLSRGDIDLFVNSTFSYLHPPITLDILGSGHNVVVEKPFARSVAECDAMIDTAEKKGVMLDVFQQSRFAPYFIKIKEIISSGVLGALVDVSIKYGSYTHRYDWQTLQRNYAGSMMNTGPHPIDQALDLFGYDTDPEVVFSNLQNINSMGDADDFVKIIFTAPGKPLFEIEISPAMAYSDYMYVIHAKNGSLRATAKKIEWKYIIPGNENFHSLETSPLSGPDGSPQYCQERYTWHEEVCDVNESVFVSGTARYYEMIYNHLTSGAPLYVTPQQVRRQIKLIEKIHADNPLQVKY